MSTQRKKPTEPVEGRYTPIPHAVLDSVAFKGASIRAKAMLYEVLRQHNGGNNGHLQLTGVWLKTRGWTSADQIQKAKNELLERGLIAKTRFGGLSTGPDWFAMTWVAISDYAGLDIRPGGFQRGLWHMMDAAPVVKKDITRSAVRSDEKREAHSRARNGPAPHDGVETTPVAPPHGAKTSISEDQPAPQYGNNECCQLPHAKSRSRVVGKKGHSGVEKNKQPAIHPSGETKP